MIVALAGLGEGFGRVFEGGDMSEREERLNLLRRRETDDLRELLAHREGVLKRFEKLGALKFLTDFQYVLIAECREVLAERGA